MPAPTLRQLLENCLPPAREDELAFFLERRLLYPDAQCAAFDRTAAGRFRAIDLFWALPCTDPAKPAATQALAETRGRSTSLGDGILCPRCKSTNTITTPIQTRSGDEPAQLQIRCRNPQCKQTSVVG